MRIKKLYLVPLALLLVAVFCIGCSTISEKDKEELDHYPKVLSGDIPEDLRLTIYYMDPEILTRMPLCVEDLISFPETKKIVIDYADLISRLERLQGLDSSMLKSTGREPTVNARLYYVMESDEFGKILEVVISQVGGNVVVNGEEVDNYNIFYELIEPFLTEEAHKMFNTGDGSLS